MEKQFGVEMLAMFRAQRLVEQELDEQGQGDVEAGATQESQGVHEG